MYLYIYIYTYVRVSTFNQRNKTTTITRRKKTFDDDFRFFIFILFYFLRRQIETKQKIKEQVCVFFIGFTLENLNYLIVSSCMFLSYLFTKVKVDF